ncbi:DEKNAAC101145 [Brettanomyces naardenensis]|uniref:DEKNAAC101145 n=1 Tax=Brettanomyces naardenensis TaxID=13370 RepID=A0A448YHG0_BRENA|nr:DEKNAAC101145 [Brettanomyces naardenensis]
MSDLQALHIFIKKPVSQEMIRFLVSTTNSVIAVAPSQSQLDPQGYPTPPSSPSIYAQKSSPPAPSLHSFIEQLVNYSHVPTSTLMSTLVYLTRLRAVLPPNSVGMETTRHRIFLGALILVAKSLNDSSPLNKHWCKYTDGLLTLADVNALELEMIDYLGWNNLTITAKDLIDNLAHFLEPIKWKLRHHNELKLSKARSQYLSASASASSLEIPLIPKSPSSSPTQPLFTYSKPQRQYSSPSSYLSPPSYRTTPRSVDSSTLSVPSLASSTTSYSTSNTTISSILTDSSESKLKSVNLDSAGLKPLRLKGYSDSGKENSYKFTAPGQNNPTQLRA